MEEEEQDDGGSRILSGTWKPPGYIPFLSSPLWPCVYSLSGQWGFLLTQALQGWTRSRLSSGQSARRLETLEYQPWWRAVLHHVSVLRHPPQPLQLEHSGSGSCKDEPASRTFAARVRLWAVASGIWLRSVGNLTAREKISSIKGCFPGAAISDASSTFLG